MPTAVRQVVRGWQLERAAWRTPEGIRLAYRKVPVATRHASYRLQRTAGGGSTFAFKVRPQRTDDAPPPRRGTIVYLHGWNMDADTMLPWALVLAERGYAGLAVDLRNHGDSSRAPAGFGPREAGDVVALLDHLRVRGELAAPVYIFGVSYGAATALFAEPALRGRIAGIVAMEPYANAADAVRTLVPGMLAQPVGGVGDRLFAHWARRHYDEEAIERAIAVADRKLDLDLAAIDLHAPLAASRTCTLLLHGARDRLIPVAAARSLAEAAPAVRYRELPDETHLTLPLRIDWLATPLVAWMQATAAGGCPPLDLPPDPLSATATATDAIRPPRTAPARPR